MVVEIGTGLGTFAAFAARAGAARVYAIEADRVIDLAREVAAAAGLLDRVTFLEGYSTAVALPETADVLIYEDFSPLFFDTDIAKILSDARGRFLKPDSRVLPRVASVRLAVVENEQDYPEMLEPLVDEGSCPFGLDPSSLREVVLNAPAYQELQPGQLLAEPSLIHGIDFRRETPEPSRHAAASRYPSRQGGWAGRVVRPGAGRRHRTGQRAGDEPGQELAAGGPPPWSSPSPWRRARSSRSRSGPWSGGFYTVASGTGSSGRCRTTTPGRFCSASQFPRPAVAASPVTVSSAGIPGPEFGIEARIPQADACPCR